MSKKNNIKTNVEIKLTKDQLEKLPLNKGITYRQLCEILNLKYVSSGNAKDVQLSEISRYVRYEIKPNKKIVINEIYETPVPKKYSYPVNTIYAKCIEEILKKYLAGRVNDNGTTYINSQHLFLVLGMINHDFINMQRLTDKQKLKEDLRVNYGWTDESSIQDSSINFYINNFYSRTKSKFSSIIDSSFKSLKNQKLLTSSTVYNLLFEETDERGNTVCYNQYTDDEGTKKILKVERKVLKDMGFSTEWEATHSKKSQEYYNRVDSEAREYFPNLTKVYKCYKLLYNLDDMQDALTNEEIIPIKKELNEKVLEFINKQANKNYLSTIDVEPGKGMKFTVNYTMAQHYLSDKLIKLH